MSFGHDGSFDHGTVERLVRGCRPDWAVESFEHAADGTDAVYFVTVSTPDGRRETVLKAREFVDSEAFRPEPVLLELFEPTPVPVPEVFGVCHGGDDLPTDGNGDDLPTDDNGDDLPTPAFLMERREGETVAVEELEPDALARLARDAGRNLAHVHRTGSFERFGSVRCRRDTATDRSAVAVDGVGDGTAHLTVAEDGYERWSAKLSAMAGVRLDDLADRFTDLREPLGAFVESRLDAAGDPAPALVHHDYRPGNLLVDTATGETRAVLDWGNPFTSDPAYNLVSVEDYCCGRVPPGHDRRERVRRAMREGHASVREPPALDERRRECYLAVSHLAVLGWFEEWYGEASEHERERLATRYREHVRTLLDRG